MSKNKIIYISNKLVKYKKKYINDKTYTMIILLLLITILSSNVFGASDPTWCAYEKIEFW